MHRKGKYKAQQIIADYDLNVFTEKQYDCLVQRAKGKTFQQIADEKGLTKQAIHASWRGVLNKINNLLI
jgi:DNA-binding NarL/FixJ family response regulator